MIGFFQGSLRKKKCCFEFDLDVSIDVTSSNGTATQLMFDGNLELAAFVVKMDKWPVKRMKLKNNWTMG